MFLTKNKSVRAIIMGLFATEGWLGGINERPRKKLNN